MIAGMAAPVALAGYWAWCDPSRVPTRKAGFAAAVAGALLGAGVGFACGTAMAAVATTLIGAVAGMNLALIACDVAGRDAAPAPGARAGGGRRSARAGARVNNDRRQDPMLRSWRRLSVRAV